MTQKYHITVPKFLLTWFIQFLYSLLKTFSLHVLTSKSLIWVQMITLGLFWTKMKFWFGFEAQHIPCILGNHKYLFLFQNVIEHSFLPQKDHMDTERIVVGPKHSALMFWHKNIVLRFQKFLLTWLIQFLYFLLKTFSSHVLTWKCLIWVQMITLGLFWTKMKFWFGFEA